jgi:hypothetical protein
MYNIQVPVETNSVPYWSDGVMEQWSSGVLYSSITVVQVLYSSITVVQQVLYYYSMTQYAYSA